MQNAKVFKLCDIAKIKKIVTRVVHLKLFLFLLNTALNHM